jgi:hypothetical protein
MEELEAQLRSLSVFPPTPDLGSGVLADIAQRERELLRSHREHWLRRYRRPLQIAAIVLIALAAALTLSSGFRSAVADVFGINGVSITFNEKRPTSVPTIPSPATGNVGETLLLGEPSTLSAAAAAVAFQILRLPEGQYGAPDEIYLRELPGGDKMVSLIYDATPGLPNTAETGVGLLLMQFKPSSYEIYIGKGVSENIDWFRGLGDDLAAWIEGTHELTLVPDPAFGCCPSSRPAASVLLWQNDGVTYRIEISLSKAEAIALAKSLTP